jgi:hypothetical protein
MSHPWSQKSPSVLKELRLWKCWGLHYLAIALRWTLPSLTYTTTKVYTGRHSS